MARVITLDASVIIAHLSPQDPLHQAASAYLEASGAEDLLMHSLNLAEVLVGGARAGRAQEMLDDLLAIGIRVAERPHDEALRLADLRADSGLKLPDCCALHTALVSGSTLATFDEHLAETARRHNLSVAPVAGHRPPQSW
jgi:predicted nucleic acid-binding protein